MAINPNNGVLDIVNGVLKVSSIDIKESGGFATAINTVARNDVLLYDDQHTNTTFLPAEGTDYRSTTGVTRDTSSIDFNDGWVYWPLKLPNSWHAQFDMRITATGGVFTFSLFNTSTPNHTDYTANDGGYKIVFDNTNNQIDVYWEGSIHATASANVRSTDWQHVNINYFRGAVSISLAGKVVLNHGFTENYQEADSRYIGFSATSGTSHEIRNLAIHNSDKWFYTHTSNASDIAYVSGNVGIGSLTPTELLDVHGNVHIAQNLTVDGNLTVTGTTFSVDQTNLSIEDPIIELAKGNASDTIDSGLVITRATSNVAVAYRGDESELALGYTQSGASETDVVPVADGGLDVRVYGNLFANNLTTTANVNATYVKGDGSELTQITLDQVVGYGNVTSNTIVSTGNIHANYFHGDGSELNNISATLQEITDNSNVTSNTVQFTNSTTALVADSNVGIGTRTPSANLHVVGYQYVNDPPTQSASFDHSDAPLTLTHSTPTSTTAIDDPKAVLHLARDGTSGESYGAKASFKMSRYENSGTASRSRLDVTLADGTYADTSVMTVRSDGRVGINTTTPGYGLDVHGTANVGALTVTSVGIGTSGVDAYPLTIFKETEPEIRIHEGATSSSAARLYSNNSNLYIQTGTNFTTGSSGDIAFQTMGGQSTHMIVKSDGKVGVGTTDPHHRIDLGDAGGSIRLGRDNDSATVTNRIGRTDLTGTNWVASVDFIDDGGSDDAIAFTTHQGGVSNGERMRIAGNGNVGIGADNPTAGKLDILVPDSGTGIHIRGGDYGSNNGEAHIRIGGNGISGDSISHHAMITGGHTSSGASYLTFSTIKNYPTHGTTPVERMRIDNNGNVGIGTIPAYKLHIYSGDDSISWYGPNSTWGGILAVGASPDRTVNNNSSVSQVITTNGNLHLDAGYNREIYMNHYSGTNVKFGSAGTLIHSSDDRLKTQEELIENATDTIMKLRPQKYLKSFRLPEDGDTREPVLESGLIVQDLWYDAPELRHLVKLADDANPSEEKPPEPVPGDIQQDPDYSDWGTMPAGMSYIGLIPYLIKSNQELYTELQDTKAQLTSVLARLDALENAP